MNIKYLIIKSHMHRRTNKSGKTLNFQFPPAIKIEYWPKSIQSVNSVYVQKRADILAQICARIENKE